MEIHPLDWLKSTRDGRGAVECRSACTVTYPAGSARSRQILSKPGAIERTCANARTVQPRGTAFPWECPELYSTGGFHAPYTGRLTAQELPLAECQLGRSQGNERNPVGSAPVVDVMSAEQSQDARPMTGAPGSLLGSPTTSPSAVGCWLTAFARLLGRPLVP